MIFTKEFQQIINSGNRYQLIYADPPWQYKDRAKAGKRGACFKYQTMNVEEIKELPVSSISATNCLLALWWTGPFMKEALEVLDAWGFDLITATGFTWGKLTKNGKRAFGMGHFTRGNAENCLFARIGNPKRQQTKEGRSVSQFVDSVVREHSRKPDEVAARLVNLMGDVKRIELFARDFKAGWHCWGNEPTLSK